MTRQPKSQSQNLAHTDKGKQKEDNIKNNITQFSQIS